MLIKSTIVSHDIECQDNEYNDKVFIKYRISMSHIYRYYIFCFLESRNQVKKENHFKY